MTIRYTTLAVVAALAGGVLPARADRLDLALMRDAPELIKSVRETGAKAVAVLPFLVKPGKATKPTFAAGTLGQDVAARLQNLLIVGNTGPQKYDVLADAAPPAAKGKKPADWTTTAGRAALAAAPLPLAWDDSARRTADLFLCGEIDLSDDLTRTSVVVKAFTRAKPEKLLTLDVGGGAKQVLSRSVRTQPSVLAAAGRSFVVKSRGFIDADAKPADEDDSGVSERIDVEEQGAADAAKRESANTPAAADSPVRLDILFDGRKVDLTSDSADPGSTVAAAANPSAGAVVTFRLTNTSADETFGVLLAVNGKNTIAHVGQQLPDTPAHLSQLWVLKPGEAQTVKRFLRDAAGNTDQFRVLPEDESAAQFGGMHPDHRGLFEMWVFGNRPASGPAITPKVEEAASITLGAAPRGLAKTRSADAARRLAVKTTGVMMVKGEFQAGGQKRGVVAGGGGNVNDGKVNVEAFEHSDQPVAYVKVRYYSR